ncbi:MAG: aminotransferase class V-fold PLP-dependent enzyme [Kordiimonadaceae bacterium]|jgi:cysteine desulfurase / selenocysteine lyase|nr:aminotransferase class V-fold PLP-dependent enzyme [Kordiimonadaceae bacterium]MDB4043890.1 aminotransferase class V-fold PLP-dependent enzyme [Emcibacteraceae bacterium]MBT6466943.1 aminotransferase class V-fold PLP-dependent enzyme [Kordiimonadaceae bacterium]MBT7544817.1 aminotransferase class V-fold PLP-dependent enzyme [Kordiimonadaceae bacterium]MBT7605461.1 aminotransferase class V-fold PLP-dependent enzyme [Kordiimonadaceae bacterium]|tara:strand:+ start:11799 stop:12974 length:1176 start_codon:yes stop_codon:yes gene_type:complete
MTLNLQKLYHDTPGKKNSIHLNNAGASLMSQQVLDTQISHLELEAAIGGYEAMAERKKEIADVYVSIAELIGANANEIAIVENATVGWAMAFYAIDFKPGDRILTVEAEYISNYMAYLHMARDKGVSIEVIPSGRDGNLCIDTLENMIDENVKLISATHIPTNSGLINAVSDIGKVAKKYNIYFLVDACQSVGQMPIDVDEIGCDMLSATGRKYLRGPRGVGFLYVRKSIIRKLHPPIIDLRSADWLNSNEYKLKEDAQRFESWESNYAAVLGLGSAVDYALNLGLNNIQLRNTELASYLRTCLKKIDTVHIHAISDRQCAITSFYVQDQTASNIVNELRKNNINTSVSDPSSTLLDANKNKLPSLIRASVHYYNDKDEIDNFIKVLSSLI